MKSRTGGEKQKVHLKPITRRHLSQAFRQLDRSELRSWHTLYKFSGWGWYFLTSSALSSQTNELN